MARVRPASVLAQMSFRGARKREPGNHNHGCGAGDLHSHCSSFTQRLLPCVVLSSCHQAHRGASSGDRPEAEHGAALRAGFVTPLPGGSGAPPAGHYDPAAQDARRTRRKCQSAVCEAVRPELESLSLSNAAVKRREARRSALLAGGPLRKGDRPNRKAATGCGVPHQRLAALHSPHARNEGDMGRQDLDDKANPAPFKEYGR